MMKRLTALLLSWVIPATSIWAAAPPSVASGQSTSRAPAARPLVRLPRIGAASPAFAAGPAPESPSPAAAEVQPPPPSTPAGSVLVGQVLSDATGLPLPDATVRIAGSEAARLTAPDGRYALPSAAGEQWLTAEKDGYVSVERRAVGAAGQGVLVLDARLTPLGAPATIGPSGGSVTAGGVSVTIDSGVLSEPTGVIVTLLSGQGVPSLPLGVAPVTAFDLRVAGTVSGPFAVRLSGLPATAAVHLVEYRPSEHAWLLTDDSLSVSDGIANASLPGVGAFAVITLDQGGPVLPGPGGPMVGSAPVPLVGITGSVAVEPVRVPVTGATARSTLTLNGPSALPSGTLVQARLTERFIGSGVSIEDEPRLQDVVAYRPQPGAAQVLKAALPLTAVHTFGLSERVTGRIHVELWTGRASQAGSVGGASESVTVESGPARLTVPAGSLAGDTAISLQSVPLSSFLPVAPGVTALGEVIVDLAGAVLSQGAELSLAGTGGGTLVIAKVDRLSGVPYLTVVSLAEVQGGRIVSTSYPDLPGIVRGGRYVFYRVDGLIGFAAGTTTSPTGPVRAVVGTAGLPFVGVSSATGGYITAAKPGPAVEVTARVPMTPHQATGTVAVNAGETASLNLALTAGLTTAEVVPADGSTGVPVSISFHLNASQPLDEATVTATSIRLIKGNPDNGPAVATRRLLSADGKTLSIVPESALEPATVYGLRIAGLKDAYGGTVSVPDTHITTKADVTPEYDLDKLKFSFPNAEGVVTVTAAAGSFPPETTVMVINDSTAAVLTMTVDNEGGIAGVGNELLATLNDVMVVSLSDSSGNTFTQRRSKYVDAATGRVAIGSTGGVVEGAGGVELRLPEGAVDRGTVFKATLVNPASLPAEQRPDLDATLASAMRIEAPSVPTFRREVDLAFPKPADAPSGAFYYVVRRVTGPEGRVFFQTLDTATVEGDKVVTNSYPFTGYDSSYGAFVYGGGGSLVIAGVTEQVAYLAWNIDQLVPQRAKMGVITGRVTRNQWNPETRQWEYVPVPGAIVRRLVDGQDPFQAPSAGTTFATTVGDGTYALFDALYTDGFVTVRATDQATGQEGEALAYGMDYEQRPVWAQHYRAVAHANIAFTATSAPRPEVTIRILERSGEAWQFSDGLVVTGQPIVIGISVANATLEQASLDGSSLALREGEAEHLGLPQVADAILTQAGPHTVAVTVRPQAGSPITETASFLVITEGGDNNQILPDRAPEVILPRLVPQPDDTGVSPGIYPEVAFTEPVANLPGQVSLHELAEDGAEGPPLQIQMYGTGPQGPVTHDAFTASSQVSVLTVRPQGGLKYLTKYRLKLSGAIHDLDSGQAGDPKELAPFSLDFETFRSGTVGGSEERFHSAGIVVLEDRAWLVRNYFLGGEVQTFDISDPVEPRRVGESASIAGRPVDMAGSANGESVPDVGRLLVVAQTTTNQSRPSNLHVFDVTEDTPRRIGAASVTRSAVDGTLTRVELKGRHAYTLTWHKGVQVVDLLRAKENYDSEVAARGNTVRMDQLLALHGQGFGHDAAVQTIRITKPHDGLPAQAPHWLLTDLKVGEYTYQGEPQTLVFVTGELGFALVNPQLGNWTMPADLQVGANRLTFGYALTLGRIDGKEVGIIVGAGQANHPTTGESTAGPVLAVVDLSEILNPSTPPGPKVLSVIPLFGGGFELASSPTDVILKDHLAVVASDRNAVIVNLSSLTQPQLVGQIEGIGGRLSLANDLILSTVGSVTGGSSELGGIRTASLSAVTVIREITENPVMLAESRRTVEPQVLHYRAVPPPRALRSAELEILHGPTTVQTLIVGLDGQGQGAVTLPPGTEHPPDVAVSARLVVNRSHPDRPRPIPRLLRSEPFSLFPDVPLTVSADEDPLAVAGVNPAILARLSRAAGPPYTSPALSWLITGGTGGQTTPPAEAPHTGLYVTGYKSGLYAGESQQVLLRMDGVPFGGTLGRTSPITIAPGRAATAGVQTNPPPGAPGRTNVVPADGATVVDLVAHDIRDAYGNLVADGTLVSWSVDGDAGTVLDPQSHTTGGRAVSRYQAGVEPGQVLLRAAIGDKEWPLFVMQEPLKVMFTQEAFTYPYENFKAVVTWGGDANYPISDAAALEWLSTYGVTEWTPLQGGVTTAQWRPTASTPRDLGRQPTSIISMSVGRARGGQAFPLRILPGEMKLYLEQQFLVGDRPPGTRPTGGGKGSPKSGPTSALPTDVTQSVLRIESGPPGETVRLTLGSTLSPVVQPVAAWPLDDLAEEQTGDVYGGPPAEVGDGITLDQETLAVQGHSLHFSGLGGLAVEGAGYLGLSSNLGLTGYVRFDSLEPGQKVLEKAGSYALTVVEQAGEPHLEFVVVSGGEQKRVLSPQALAAATWYQFSAQWKDGRLRLAVGPDTQIGLSEPVGPIDPSSSPLVFGPTLLGHLDHLQFFDLSRPPLAVFPGNTTQIELALDADGNAETVVTATGAWQTPGLFAAPTTADAASVASDAVPSGQNIPVLVHVALDPPSQETYGHYLGVHTEEAVRQCTEGIATGENAEWTGIGCDIALSFYAPLAIPLAIRDLTVTGTHIVKGKATVGNYVVGAFALISIIPERLPLVGPLLQRLSRAADAFHAPWVKKKLADKALDAAVEAATDGVVRTADERLVRIAAGEAGEEARTALHNVFTRLDPVKGPSAWDGLERLARSCAAAVAISTSAAIAAAAAEPCYIPEDLLVKLDRLAADHGAQAMTDVLEILIKVDLPEGLSDDALDGLAIFTRHLATTNAEGWGRTNNLWDHIAKLPDLTQGRRKEIVENFFTWIKQGEAVNPPILGWDDFLKKGPGTLANGTAGAYHVLDFMANELNWTGIRRLEVPVINAAGEMRFLDIQMADGRIFEMKNLLPGRTIHDLAQITKDVDAAKERALARRPEGLPGFAVIFREELSKLNYVFRGTRQDMVNAVTDLRNAARDALGPYAHLEPYMSTRFLERGTPY